MLEVTELAVKNLKSYMQENKIDSALRVAIMQGGWSGPSLGLALDEPKDNDKTFEEEGLTFLVDDDLLKQCNQIKVDFLDAGHRSGFSISSTVPIAGGGSCGSGCGSGTCGWFFYSWIKTPGWLQPGVFLFGPAVPSAGWKGFTSHWGGG
jgi:iron-sulfur cluster assembly protein